LSSLGALLSLAAYKMTETLPKIITDFFGDVVGYGEPVKIIHEGNTYFGDLGRCYVIDERAMIGLKDPDNSMDMMHFPITEIILLRDQIIRQDYRIN